MDNNSSVKYGSIVVDHVQPNSFNPERVQAQIRQTVTRTYAGTSDEFQEKLFTPSEFKSSKREFSETRVAWIDVPKGTTKKAVEEKFKGHPTATLYRILSDKPIFSENQKQGIAAGLTTADIIAERQKVKFGSDHPQAGQDVLRNGKPMYRRIGFSLARTADEDRRSTLVPDVQVAVGQQARQGQPHVQWVPEDQLAD